MTKASLWFPFQANKPVPTFRCDEARDCWKLGWFDQPSGKLPYGLPRSNLRVMLSPPESAYWRILGSKLIHYFPQAQAQFSFA